MNYKTYAEAKIANPDSEIVTTGKNWCGGKDLIGAFEAVITGSIGRHIIDNKSWVICNPADYCSSLKEFLEAGFKFSVGDFFIGVDGEVISIRDADSSSVPCDDDYKRYILSTAALSGGCKIPAKAEQWTVYNNTMPLCELSDEQYGKVRRMHDAGMSVEWRSHSIRRWELLSTPTWNADGIYRIKQKSGRELFIENSSRIMHSVEGDGLINDITLGALYDNGLRYRDLTQHFGENI